MKFLDVFAGIGGFRFGLMEAGHTPVGHIEKDKYAIKSYNAIYDTEGEFEARDVREVKAEDLPEFDLLTGGFPCFPQGTNIVTKNGIRNIEDIEIGDKVLTHKRIYREVIDTMNREYFDELVSIDVPYNIDIKVTKEHPFYIKRDKDSEAEWIDACDLKEGYYVSTPIENNSGSEYTFIYNNILLRSTNNDNHNSFTEKGYLWSKIEGVEYIEQEGVTVYNIAVREDQSYTAEGFIVHNCQSFSVAGKRGGFEDTRGTLFFEIARLAKKRLPEYLLLENVKGLLSHDEGKTFATILNTLHNIGYKYLEWQVLNSKNFSKDERPTPQNRERVFIVGHLRGGSRGKVFPIGRKDTGTLKEYTSGMSQGYRVYDTDGVSCTLNAKGGGLGAKTGLYIDKEPDTPKQFSSGEGISYTIDKNYHKGLAPSQVGNGRRTQVVNKSGETEVIGNTVPSGHSAGNIYHPLGISPTVRENHGKVAKTVVKACLTPNRLNKRQNGRRIKDEGEPMFTLTKTDVHGLAIKEATKKGYDIAQPGDSVNYQFPNSNTRRGRVGKEEANTLETSNKQGVVTEDYRIRKLTPKETWRLQGFPDKLFNKAKEQGLSDTQLYKQAGNSVTTNVVEAIGKRLKEIEEEKNE